MGLEAKSGFCMASEWDRDVGLRFTDLDEDFLQAICMDGNGNFHTFSIFV